MPCRTKGALAVGVRVGGQSVLQVIDTKERSCPDQACGYTFNFYEWPWVTAPMPPEDNK